MAATFGPPPVTLPNGTIIGYTNTTYSNGSGIITTPALSDLSRLAEFIEEHVPGEEQTPSVKAVDAAIRIIKEQREALLQMTEMLEQAYGV